MGALQLLQPGTLWEKIVWCTEQALACGALQPIPTQSTVIDQAGISFLVRILENLARKETAKRQQDRQAALGKDFNPFLPYDPDLFVADCSETHLYLLNKYNVVAHHLLIVTRHFVDQETRLTREDFTALWLALTEIDGLGFYNSGRVAGASQRHKHLQVVPLPLSAAERVPIEAAFTLADWQNPIVRSAVLPFRHAAMPLSWNPDASLQAVVEQTLTAYETLMTDLNLLSPDSQLLGAYNLLITRQWMLIIPRQQEQFETISVNSLGFAGTLFVRDAVQLERLQTIGPLTLLQQVAVPLAAG